MTNQPKPFEPVHMPGDLQIEQCTCCPDWMLTWRAPGYSITIYQSRSKKDVRKVMNKIGSPYVLFQKELCDAMKIIQEEVGLAGGEYGEFIAPDAGPN